MSDVFQALRNLAETIAPSPSRDRIKADRRRANNQCPTCGGTPKPGCKTCPACLRRAADRRRRWRLNELCVDCRADSKTRRCRPCQLKNQARRDRRTEH